MSRVIFEQQERENIKFADIKFKELPYMKPCSLEVKEQYRVVDP